MRPKDPPTHRPGLAQSPGLIDNSTLHPRRLKLPTLECDWHLLTGCDDHVQIPIGKQELQRVQVDIPQKQVLHSKAVGYYNTGG